MAKFTEKELTENLKDFADKTELELEFEKGIDGKVLLSNAKIEYDEKYGYIYITSDRGSFKINTTLVCRYEKVENEIDIDLESLLLKIRETK